LLGDSRQTPLPVYALGIMSVGEPSRRFARHRDELRASVGAIAEDERGRIADYLRSDSIVFAPMEHTRDMLDGAFETPGGSGILTDRSYYWRMDCADYVQHYGVALPREFLDHIKGTDWESPAVSPERVLEIDRYLMKMRCNP
jgi:hypothetical protein